MVSLDWDSVELLNDLSKVKSHLTTTSNSVWAKHTVYMLLLGSVWKDTGLHEIASEWLHVLYMMSNNSEQIHSGVQLYLCHDEC